VCTRSFRDGGWFSRNISQRKLPARAKGADSQKEKPFVRAVLK
jgi:hypothetical protein